MKTFKKLSLDEKLNFDNIYPTINDAICKINLDIGNITDSPSKFVKMVEKL